jgi:uncharacterized NAD-dependent epimerase/dehydratase family protein
VNLPLQWYVPYLDYRVRELCRARCPDIVLVGAQSGTIPYDVHEHTTHTLPSLAFLLGTKPDACILVVNSIDAHGYIQHTIDALQSVAKAPTILLAMGDKEKHIRAAYGRTVVSPRQMSRAEIDRKLEELENAFHVPAVEILSERGQDRMIETIINHFSAHSAETA